MTNETGARKRILLAAERLFAERGIDPVSLREIGLAAGQRNNSAVQYHFGDKERLIRALYEQRLPPLNRRRLELLNELRANGDDGDLHALIGAYARPLAEAVEQGGSDGYYARFVARFLAERGQLAAVGIDLAEEAVSGIRELNRLLERSLSALPRPVRHERLRQMTLLITTSLGDLERRKERDEPIPLSGEAFVVNLVDAAVGLLTAPASALSRGPSAS